MPNEDRTFKPTPDWMAVKYNEMNKTLFNGELGECDFAIFTTGKGSEGGTLGWFKIIGKGLKGDRYSRRMYRYNSFGEKEWITKKSFVQICKPKIELNGNYSGTENAFLATLVHEMCHYYNYMYGYIPKQAHGPEFREIASIVSRKSNGLFTIQRLASAEQMQNLDLSDEMKAKRERRLANKKASATAILVVCTNGDRKLGIFNNRSLENKFIEFYSRTSTLKILVSNDPNLIGELFARKYNSILRSIRYWLIKDKQWIDDLFEKCDSYAVFENNKVKQTQQPQPQSQPVNKGKLIFSINTNNGKFEIPFESMSQLTIELKNKFPFLSDQTLDKIIQNNSNYRMAESRKTISNIISETIDKFLDEEFGGDVDISPEMNLGIESPLEID